MDTLNIVNSLSTEDIDILHANSNLCIEELRQLDIAELKKLIDLCLVDSNENYFNSKR